MGNVTEHAEVKGDIFVKVYRECSMQTITGQLGISGRDGIISPHYISSPSLEMLDP